MIIAKANPDNFPWDESPEMVDYAIEKMEKAAQQHRASWMNIGNLVAATSEEQLNKALRIGFAKTYAWYYGPVLL